jgi:hypothetical protein
LRWPLRERETLETQRRIIVRPPVKIRVLDDVVSEHRLQVWTYYSLLRSVVAAKTAKRRLDPMLLFGVILIEANLPADGDSAGFLVRWISERAGWTEKTGALSLFLPIPDLGPAPAPPSAGRNPLHEEDAAFLGEALGKANVLRERTAPYQREIDTRHMLATLLRTPQIRSFLEEKKLPIADLNRDLCEFILRTHPNDVALEWRRFLLGAGFELRTLVSRDTWTRDDTLGYRLYAQAITESILDGTTEPPLTIGIQAPWGQGKTSLMRMIQERLDPDAPRRDEVQTDLYADVGKAVRTTYRDLLRWIRQRLGTAAHARRFSGNGMLDVDASRVPTVWFNPLYYRETSQVWAGMAHSILHQLARQLPPADREQFWLQLQIARINPALVRREIHQQILMRAVPLGVAAALIVLFLPMGGLLESLLGLGGGSLLGLIWGKASTIGARFEKYISEPDYQSELGLLHLVDQDLDVALRLLVGSRPIAVFIDDLDRCDPATVNQVILAINQFLSLPRRNVFFFLGMDMEMVAGALEQAQKETLTAVGGAQRRSYGWRFMEKFVQLPFVIPHLDAEIARTFAVEYLSGDARPETASAEEVIQRVRKVQYAEEIGEIAREALASNLSPDDRANLQQEFSRRAQELMKDPESDEVERIVTLAIDDLELNPRTMKRYFALVRLLRNVQLSTGKVKQADVDRVLVLRAAHLLLNWPQFVQWIGAVPSILEAGEWRSTLTAVETIAKAATDHGEWCKRVKALTGSDAPSFLHDVPLYRFIRRIALDPPDLSAIHAARMF